MPCALVTTIQEIQAQGHFGILLNYIFNTFISHLYIMHLYPAEGCLKAANNTNRLKSSEEL